MNIRDLFLGSLPMNIHELISPIQTVDSKRKKIAKNWGVRYFEFFSPKACSGSWSFRKCHVEPYSICILEDYTRRTDGRTDGQTDGRRANFLERYVFDNHPFGVDKKADLHFILVHGLKQSKDIHVLFTNSAQKNLIAYPHNSPTQSIPA